MGFTMLYQYPITDNKTGPQVIEYLTKKVLKIGATQVGHFLVDFDTFVSMPGIGPQRSVHVLHNSEHPASVFAILETANKVVPLVADNLFDLLILKIQNIYTNKKNTKLESKGPRFAYGDFIIKLGNVTTSQANFKGVLIEIDYGPLIIPSLCWEMMRELVTSLFGSTVSHQIPPHLQNRMNEPYQPIDTIHQYLDHFTQFRKVTS